MSDYSYSHTLGIASFEGRGFMNPVDVRFSKDNYLYVLSRSNAGNRNVRVSAVTLDSEFLFEFANWGTDPGLSTQPTAIAVGPDQRVYLTDEFTQLLSVFDKDGTFLHRWGETGSEDGKWNRPSGLAFDSEGHLHVVDHLNARIQKYTVDGEYISSFGTFGTGPGEFNYPWGISIDAEDCIWIVDWRNDRVQRFTPDGEFIFAFGSSGTGDGEFDRPFQRPRERRRHGLRLRLEKRPCSGFRRGRCAPRDSRGSCHVVAMVPGFPRRKPRAGKLAR